MGMMGNGVGYVEDEDGGKVDDGKRRIGMGIGWMGI